MGGWIEDEMMPAMWVIINPEVNKPAHLCGQKSGVLLKNNRILTCFHGFGNENDPIAARMLTEDGFHNMKILHKREDWDLALLEFEVDPGNNYKYLELSDNEVLTLDDTLYCLGTQNRRQGVAASGSLSRSCVTVDPSTFKYPIENYKIPDAEVVAKRHALAKDLQFASIGNYDTYLNLHPNLPLIVARMTTDHGLSGCPFFRFDRKIVGILLSRTRYETFAIHLSALKEFVKEADENVSGASTSS